MSAGASPYDQRLVRWLTYLMFMMFAMTTDAVGVVIPQVIEEFDLSLAQASAFHYATMVAIAVSGVLLGFLADKIGRKAAIVIGLSAFAGACFLFPTGERFGFFLVLLLVSGAAVGVFKTGALALIGDISSSSPEHTRTMNTVEGFFGVGAIIGPAIVTALLAAGWSWKYLYAIAGLVCLVLLAGAATARYPRVRSARAEHIGVAQTFGMLKNRYALGFAGAIALYVATEAAIYVWMPTLLRDYEGGAAWLATYALTVFFLLRAGGRFLGAWVLRRYHWATVMVVFSGAILLCFAGSMALGVAGAVYLLPVSGLFMSMIYPTLNSKGISCFPKREHGSVAGVILFFTAASAAVAPLLMGAVGDWLGNVAHGFVLATGFAGLLFAGMLYNWLAEPAAPLHRQRDEEERVTA
jgi:fucose permease